MKKIILFTISTLMLTGCGTYSRYHRADIPTEKLYRNIPAGIDTTTLASMSWREMFTDRKLQFLIETGLRQNTDLNVARLRVEAAEAALMTARLSYLPSLGISAEGSGNKYDGATAKAYNVGASASWELELFGKLTAAKRGAVAALQGSRDFFLLPQCVRGTPGGSGLALPVLFIIPLSHRCCRHPAAAV